MRIRGAATFTLNPVSSFACRHPVGSKHTALPLMDDIWMLQGYEGLHAVQAIRLATGVCGMVVDQERQSVLVLD